jgi:hypothetical protein
METEIRVETIYNLVLYGETEIRVETIYNLVLYGETEIRVETIYNLVLYGDSEVERNGRDGGGEVMRKRGRGWLEREGGRERET